jgi:hypothetical protein
MFERVTGPPTPCAGLSAAGELVAIGEVVSGGHQHFAEGDKVGGTLNRLPAPRRLTAVLSEWRTGWANLQPR